MNQVVRQLFEELPVAIQLANRNHARSSLGDLVHDNELREAGERDECVQDGRGGQMKAEVIARNIPRSCWPRVRSAIATSKISRH